MYGGTTAARWGASAAMLALASTCAPYVPEPIYATTYHYAAPDSEQGRVCVMQCEVNRSQCQEMGRMRADACEQRARADHEQCEERAQTRYDECLARQQETPGTFCLRDTCHRETCSSATDECELHYNRCFEVCGGTVTEETRCIENCERPR